MRPKIGCFAVSFEVNLQLGALLSRHCDLNVIIGLYIFKCVLRFMVRIKEV